MYIIDDIKNTIIKGDALEELKKIPDNSIDLIFADPPYYMQTEGELLRTNGGKFNGVDDEWDKFNGFEDYDNFSVNWLKECQRILKITGSIWVIGSFQNIFRIGKIMQDLGFWILNDIIWSKSNPVPNFGGTRFCNAHETLLWCGKNKNTKYTFNYKTMKHLNNDKQDKSVWNIALCTGRERLKDKYGNKVHSTQKPEKLLFKVILSSSKPDDIVLDPFFGTGTTGAVAKRLSRNYIGIERESKYILYAEERIKNTETELTDLINLNYEVKPPKVPIKNLIKKGYLKPNQILYTEKGEEVCKLNEDGNVENGLGIFSIHQMSAKLQNLSKYNGWNYFYTYYNVNLYL
ncbi:site-specific DNA-methyltransferase [uncultured Brachyspira sp.]|uniref:DNA-methyltransferase n=1 Tax=uncultured Brachyspira sp. TaxID=221953 RepID=UPI0025D2C5A4|nr:site-specific DNA-methyltransferase [uncultured Brachyspira sp.]